MKLIVNQSPKARVQSTHSEPGQVLWTLEVLGLYCGPVPTWNSGSVWLVWTLPTLDFDLTWLECPSLDNEYEKHFGP